MASAREAVCVDAAVLLRGTAFLLRKKTTHPTWASPALQRRDLPPKAPCECATKLSVSAYSNTRKIEPDVE